MKLIKRVMRKEYRFSSVPKKTWNEGVESQADLEKPSSQEYDSTPQEGFLQTQSWRV
jgi:hypothetical protein